nr:hypothetical transcript [Hymenolepis microstoma]
MARRMFVNTTFVEELDKIREIISKDPKSHIRCRVLGENKVNLVFECDEKKKFAFDLLIPREYPLSSIEWRARSKSKRVDRFLTPLNAKQLGFIDQAVLITHMYYRMVCGKVPEQIVKGCTYHFLEKCRKEKEIKDLQDLQRGFIYNHFVSLLKFTWDLSTSIGAGSNQEAKIPPTLQKYFTKSLEIQRNLLEEKLNISSKFFQDNITSRSQEKNKGQRS